MRNYDTTDSIAVPDRGSSGRRLLIAASFTGIAITAMLIQGNSAETVVVWGAALFGAAYALEALSHSPLLIAWIVSHQEEQTKREEIWARYHIVVEEPDRMGSAGGLQALPEPPAERRGLPDNFVPSVEESDYLEAVAFVRQLYGEFRPDRKKVSLDPPNPAQRGRLLQRVPSSGALDWLMRVGIVREIKVNGKLNGYALNLEKVPTLPDLLRALEEHKPLLPISEDA